MVQQESSATSTLHFTYQLHFKVILLKKAHVHGGIFPSILSPYIRKDFITANVNVFNKQTTHQVNVKQNFQSYEKSPSWYFLGTCVGWP